MITNVDAPRLNANDDTALVVAVHVEPGQRVAAGEALIELETTKAVAPVEAPCDGFVRAVPVTVGQEVPVGQLLVVIADTMEEPVSAPDKTSRGESAPEMTVRARVLARSLGLSASDFDGVDGRITVADVEKTAAGRRAAEGGLATSAPADARPLAPVRLGMARTVRASARNAVAAYLETVIDTRRVAEFAARWQETHGRLVTPEAPVVAYAFVQCIAERPEFNAAARGDEVVRFPDINLGFAVDTPGGRIEPVVKDAASLSLDRFIDTMSELQRAMFAGKRGAGDIAGATIGFTSLAAYGVTSHTPLLLPGTSVMLAHSSPASEGDESRPTTFGVTYDHQLHAGAEVARMLQALRALLEEPSLLA